MGKKNNLQETVNNVLGEIAERRSKAMERAGTEDYKSVDILIPNPDKNDHRPWQTFVTKSNHVHENKFGKGMWIKLPAKGHTTMR